MKKNMLVKDFFMEIRKSKARFFSILLIVVLGVAFFAGIRAASPDMQLSADAFYDAQKLMDIRVLGDYGLTDSDVEAISAIDGVEEVMPGYSTDVLCEKDSSKYVLRMMSIPDKMNLINVKEGRLPQSEGECLLDERLISKENMKIGDQIEVYSGTEEDIADTLQVTSYTVVGYGSSPYYLSLDRGTSKVGDGSLTGFVIIPEEDFALDVYTEICIRVQGSDTYNCYSDSYDKRIDEITDKIEEIADARCEIRYDAIQAEGQEDIAEAEEKIADAKQKLSDAEEKITDGEKQLQEGKETLAEKEKELSEGREKLEESKQQLADAKVQLADGKQTLLDSKNKLIQGQEKIDTAKIQLNEKETQLEQAKQGLDTYQQELEKTAGQKSQLEAYILDGTSGLDTMKQQAEVLKELVSQGDAQAAQDLENLNVQIQQNEAQLAGLTSQLETLSPQYEAAKADYASKKTAYEEGRAALDQAWTEVTANQASIDNGWDSYYAGKEELESKENEYSEGLEKYEQAKLDLADGEAKLADAKSKIQKSEEELEDGRKELETERKSAEEKISDGEQEITDGKQTLRDMRTPVWYVLDRDTIQTYVEYDQDSQRIAAIGNVFPVIFFLVAALVCLTTMTRMVEENRVQIGTLKALGYSKIKIAAKYICYAFLASFIGSLIGLVLGQLVLPKVIIEAYGILYNNLPTVLTPLHFNYSISSAALAILCTTAATVFACYKELASVPAKLMRPAAPKRGKRIFLERIRFIWKRLNFTQKATFRNLIRYKKRFFMTVFGIGGCMGLLLVGFGLKDSIMAIGTLQFGEIRTYNSCIYLNEDLSEKEKEEIDEKIKQDKNIRNSIYVCDSSVDVSNGSLTKSSYLLVPKDKDSLTEFVQLRDRVTKESYTLDDEGIIITEKLAKLMNVGPGDEIELQKDDIHRVKVKISHVVENYFYHYVVISPALYESVYGEPPKFKEIYTINTSKEESFEKDFQTRYMDMNGIDQVSFLSGIEERIANMLKSMDMIIWVLVVSAGLLAFVVLYNLNNINISERKRELATLKVLGFYETEVSAYVMRENIWLTLIGSMVGIAFGFFLHRYVIVTAEIDIMMFGRQVKTVSYIYSILLTFLFSMIINAIMYFKLKKIDMVESMKSVE